MIKSNSKKAIANIVAYIMTHYDGSDYEIGSPEASAKTFEEIARVILSDVKRVKGYEVERYSRYTWQEAFEDWASGLPSMLDTCYYYNRSAVEDLGAILEETEAEKSKYTEEKACKYLSCLIYRELVKAAPEVLRR